MEMVGFGVVFFFLLLLMVLGYLYRQLVWKPLEVRSKLEKQGIRGPPTTSFLFGNIPQIKAILHHVNQSSISDSNASAMNHHWPSSVFPHLQTWTKQYGGIFMYSIGSIQQLYITDVEMVKQISLCTSLSLGKPTFISKERGPLLGQGIFSSSGPIWAHQRKIIAPEFYIDKVKNMLNLMINSTVSMLKTWESKVESEGRITDIRIDEDLRSLSADIISRACFGSNYSQGEQIFLKVRQLQNIMCRGFVGIPGLRYVPTKNNRQIWKLHREVDSMILNVVKQRAKASYEKDLLQMILEAANSSGGDNNDINMARDKFVVDNCKSVYFAGHETTAITASWCLMLLAKYPEWQVRVRAEVQGICGDDVFPDADMLRSMKVLTMVIQETLRLYPPAAFVIRETMQDMKFKDLQVPKGINIQIPIFALQHNVDLWGPDAHGFNPERFSNGVLGACKSAQAYMPFGAGSRTCLGQYFAMAELKVVLSLVLSKFSFSLSPSYKHSPAFRLVIQPDDGVHLCVRKL